jgi:hypothetical protein
MAQQPLDPPFTFSYRLTDVGWAEADLAATDQSVRLTASYLSDALDNLLGAIEHVLNGAETSEAFWDEEPGRFHWDLERQGPNVHLRIFVEEGTRREWPQPRWKAPSGVQTRETDERPEFCVFAITVPMRIVARTIAEAAANVLAQEGELAYWDQWRAARFPVSRLWRIQDELGTSRTPIPDPAPRDPDPVRAPLRELWTAFLTGQTSPDDTLGLIDAGEFSRRSTTPVVRQAIRTLRSDAGSVGWRPDAASSSAAHYSEWVLGLDLYDKDPLEWARKYWRDSLADAVAGLSGKDAKEVAEGFRGLLEDADLNDVIRNRRRSRILD